MDRLLNINRPGGFPLCAETLGILNENSEMLNKYLQALPGMVRSAILLGEYLFVSDAISHTHRIMKIGDTLTSDFENCKLQFHTATHGVYDSDGSEVADVWRTETADIVPAAQGDARWRIFTLEEVFELTRWQYLTNDFASLLPMASVQGSGTLVNTPSLTGDSNTIRINGDGSRIQLDFSLNIDLYANLQTVLRIPVPFTCRAGVRLNANLKDSTGSNYPVRAMISTPGQMSVNIGRWLRDEIGWTPSQGDVAGYERCMDVITVNTEILSI